MEFCPHCQIPFDPDNETQPCCGSCGHPFTFGCCFSRDKATYASDQSRFFCSYLDEALKEHKDWEVISDRVLPYKNIYGNETTKRQISIHDRTTHNKLHVNFFKNGGTYIQDIKGGSLYNWVKQTLMNASSLASDLRGVRPPVDDENWEWELNREW